MTIQGYLFFLVIEFAIWNLGFGRKLDSAEYVWPLIPAIVGRMLFRWRQSKAQVKAEHETVIGRDEMLKLIRRVDEAHKKVEGIRGIILASQVLSPLWPILLLIVLFLFLASGVTIPFPSNLIFTTSLLALAISVLSMSWNFVENQSKGIEEAFEKRIFDSVKLCYSENDHSIVRAVIGRRLKSGRVKLESVFQMNAELFTRKALGESLVE